MIFRISTNFLFFENGGFWIVIRGDISSNMGQYQLISVEEIER